VAAGGAQPLFDSSTGEQPVRGFLHRPATPNDEGLVLTHGAGGNCQSPLLVTMADLFSAAGATVLRCDLPFRQARPHGPPFGGSGKHDQQGLRSAVGVLKRFATGRVLLGGHSYGGRQASMLASAEPSLVSRLILLSYPLHPPKRPAQLRTEHLPHLRNPVLFVHGSSDPFGSIQEMESALKLIPAPAKLMVVESVGHSLVSGRKPCEQVAAVIVSACDTFFEK
jgi:predicted alpha/beta-hydrolase family hydrolase